MTNRSLLLAAVGAGLLVGPAASMAETHLYNDRSAWAAQATVVGTETYDSYTWKQPGGDLLVWGGSYTLGKLRYRVPADSALFGVWSAITQDAPYLTGGNYLQWQAATEGPTTLTIDLPTPVASIGFDIGQLHGSSLPFVVTLGNGDSFNLATRADSYRFVGLVSDEPFSSLTITAAALPLIDDLQWRGGRRSAFDPAAGALRFNPDGIGHILIFPYFSTQSGNATLLNIINTDELRGKAVKIRFRGASNADSIFNFQLFLSPGDVWAAHIGRAANGLSTLSTADRSCTLPSNVNREFVTARLNTVLAADELANETREGYVEIITMGDIPPSADPASLWRAISHDAAGTAPCTASVLESLAVADPRLARPTTGLTANWGIVNVPNTTLWSGDALAVEARFGETAGEGRNVYWPQTADVLTDEQREANTADPLFRSGAVIATSRDLPDLSTPYVPSSTSPMVQATALSDAMATTQVAVEYLTDPAIHASTDWVFSAPTRRYYAAVDYASAGPVEQLITNYDTFGIELADYYTSAYSNSLGNLIMGNDVTGGRPWQACVRGIYPRFRNREGWLLYPTPPIIMSPGPRPYYLCGATASLGVTSATSPIGANVARNVISLPAGSTDGDIIDGWSQVTFLNSFDGVNLGLPLLAIQFSKATNSAVSPGVSGTFGAAWKAREVQRGAFFVP